MARTVLLLHTLADGASHYDWMLERGSGDASRGLLTFRVQERIDQGAGDFCAERLADHRPAYLEYEGEVSGLRGEVRRVAVGECQILDETEDFVRVRMSLGARMGEWAGRRASAVGQVWEFCPAQREA